MAPVAKPVLAAVLPLVLLAAAPLGAQTAAKPARQAQVPAKPAAAAKPPQYPDSEDGLKHLLQDVLASAKASGSSRLAVFVEDMEIPNYAEWFPKTFGNVAGGALAQGYSGGLNYLNTELQAFFLRLAGPDVEIATRKVNDDPASDEERALVRLFQSPVDVFFASSRVRNGASAAPDSPAAPPDPIGYFWFVDGKFRWDPMNRIGNLRSALPDPEELTDLLGAGSPTPAAGSSSTSRSGNGNGRADSSSDAQSQPKFSPDSPPDASPSADSARTRSLSPSEALIERAREAAFEFSEKLPNFICEEFMARYRQRGRDETSLDVVSAEIIYDNAKESYRNVKINDRPTDEGLQEIDGSWSTGEFASTLLALFSSNTNAQFHYGGPSPISGASAEVYDFQVRSENSRWMIHIGSQTLQAAYAGSVWVDPKTARVLRIEMQARDIPANFPMNAIESAVDYSYVSIGGTSFLLPVHAESLGCPRDNGDCSHNVIDFRNYHEFKVDVKIGN